VGTRRWFRVHSFTGVVTGLLLFVICWSGTFAVLSNEFDRWVTPALSVEAEGDPAGWEAWLDAIDAHAPAARVLRLQAPPEAGSTVNALVRMEDGRFAVLSIDPYRAAVTGEHAFMLQRFFRDLHRRLFLGDFGLYLVCAFGISLLASLVAALMFYRRWWARFLRFRPSRGRAFWSEAHKLAGLWSLWFVLLMGITGIWYLFEAARLDFGDGKINYAGDGRFAVLSVPPPRVDSGRPLLPLDELVSQAQHQRPELDIAIVALEPDKIIVTGQAGHLLARDRANQIHLNRRTGEVLYNQAASDLPAYWRWVDMADPLHFGDFAGLTSKLIWFVFGVVLSGLILSGTWLHAHRLARQAGSRRRHRWPGTLAAMVASLAVLVAAVPAALVQARAAFGPIVDGARTFPSVAPGVQWVIIGWIAVTLALLALWVLMLWQPERLVGSRASDPSRALQSDCAASTDSRPRAETG